LIDNSRGDPVPCSVSDGECGGRGDSRREIVGRIGAAARGDLG
jgi:hypothetical protein